MGNDREKVREVVEQLKEQCDMNRLPPREVVLSPEEEFVSFVMTNDRIKGGGGSNKHKTAINYLKEVQQFLSKHAMGPFEKKSDLAQKVFQRLSPDQRLRISARGRGDVRNA